MISGKFQKSQWNIDSDCVGLSNGGPYKYVSSVSLENINKLTLLQTEGVSLGGELSGFKSQHHVQCLSL